ncbi:uncharacterized protein [Magallana gigas]|uniref:uncharacterized protein n=1 Tax=Magallana gigas TaxID=29159 RepID=UPI003340F4A5
MGHLPNTIGSGLGSKHCLTISTFLLVLTDLIHVVGGSTYKYYSQRRYSTGSSTPEGTAILIGVIVGIMAVIGAIGVSIWCCAHKAKKKARLQHRAMMTTGVAGAQIRHGGLVAFSAQQQMVYSNPAFTGGGVPYGQPPPLYSDPSYPSMPPVDGGGAHPPLGYDSPGFTTTSAPPLWNKLE